MSMEATDFVGRGWRFPPRLNARGGWSLVDGVEEIEGSIRMILLTAPGERVMRPEFGCRVWDYLYDPINANTLGAMRNAMEEALDRWEPRVVVEAVTVRADPDRVGSVLGEVTYTIKQTNDRRNLVVPFYEIGEEA